MTLSKKAYTSSKCLSTGGTLVKRMQNKPMILTILIVLFLLLALYNQLPDNSEEQSQTSPLQSTFALTYAQEQTGIENRTDDEKRNSPDEREVEKKSKPIANYHIYVRLDEQDKRLFGRQTIVWNHPGFEPVEEVYFHLYPNAFASKKTSFMRESGGKLRNDRFKNKQYGSMQIEHITLKGRNVGLESEFVQPDDGNRHDQTLLKVMLPEPIQPGERAVFDLRFEVKMPFAFARMGTVDDFVMAGQWFPKISMYETAGMRGRKDEGWNIHQYHGNSEFYANFGKYRVHIDAPSHYNIAATGELIQQTSEQEGRTVHTYEAEDVHDFAWAASPHFLKYSESFQLPNGHRVQIQLFLDPAHEHLSNRYFYAASSALLHFSEWFAPYPYPTLSIVVPPPGGGGAGGMEYPTLITAWAADDEHPGYELERVIVHEIAHQYFYGLVASNEFEEAWLDEAFTSYAEDRLMKEEYGLIPRTGIESSYITSPAPLNLYAWDYHNHHHYADNVYIRGKLVLKEIEKRIGSEWMNVVLRTYFQRWMFDHPSTEDFLEVLQQVTDRNWRSFFETFVYEGGMTDFAVQAIHSEPVTVKGKETWEHQIWIERLGAIYPKVPVQIHFTDGSSKVIQFDGRKQEMTKLTIQHNAQIDRVVIDPKHTMMLENRRINNVLRANVEPEERTYYQLIATHVIDLFMKWLVW